MNTIKKIGFKLFVAMTAAVMFGPLASAQVFRQSLRVPGGMLIMRAPGASHVGMADSLNDSGGGPLKPVRWVPITAKIYKLISTVDANGTPSVNTRTLCVLHQTVPVYDFKDTGGAWSSQNLDTSKCISTYFNYPVQPELTADVTIGTFTLFGKKSAIKSVGAFLYFDSVAGSQNPPPVTPWPRSSSTTFSTRDVGLRSMILDLFPENIILSSCQPATTTPNRPEDGTNTGCGPQQPQKFESFGATVEITDKQ